MNSGEVAIIDSTTIEISELPVKTWTQVGIGWSMRPYLSSKRRTHIHSVHNSILNGVHSYSFLPFWGQFYCFHVLFSVMQNYKENVLEPMMNGTEKVPSLITDFREYHTDTTVRFVVKMPEEKLREAEAAGLHKVFKLQTPLTCSSMVIQATRCM